MSGPLAAGKTTLAEGIAQARGSQLVRVREVIRDLADVEFTRAALISAGIALERKFGPQWLVNNIAERLSRSSSSGLVVDAVRTRGQAVAMKSAFPGAILIHVTAPREVREGRFTTRPVGEFSEASTFGEAAGGDEREIDDEVRGLASCVIDTGELSTSEALAAALACIGHDEP